MTESPELYINEEVVRRNIEKMSRKALHYGMQLRPHFKTHQCAEVASWFGDHHISRCAVSSLKMAWYFARHGWKDILIAFPLIPAQAEEYNRLAQQVSLTLFLSDPNSLRFFSMIRQPVKVMVEIDTGHHRTGIGVWEEEKIWQVVQHLQQNQFIEFGGFAVHAGETYHCSGESAVGEALARNLQHIKKLKARYPGACVSYGDTPSLSLGADFEGIDEARPGNFVFYDLMQLNLGACAPEEIALHLLCPVVASYPQRKQVVIHGGAVHLSKEYLSINGGEPVYGHVVAANHAYAENMPAGIKETMEVIALSQEHGIIRATHGQAQQILPGQSLPVIPVHSCLAASQFNYYREMKTRRIIPKMSL